jgi:hypothetical protein
VLDGEGCFGEDPVGCAFGREPATVDVGPERRDQMGLYAKPREVLGNVAADATRGVLDAAWIRVVKQIRSSREAPPTTTTRPAVENSRVLSSMLTDALTCVLSALSASPQHGIVSDRPPPVGMRKPAA